MTPRPTARPSLPRAARLAALALLVLLAACITERAGRGPSPYSRRVPPAHDGPFTTWWADDRVREEGSYRGGRRHGEVRGYHPDGSLAFEGRFADGVPQGELKQYAPGGVLAIVQHLEPGGGAGERIEYWPEGTPRLRVEVAGGRRHGALERWHADGTPALRGQYALDLPVGEWVAFDAQGRVDARTVYFTGGGAPAGYLETVFDDEGRVSVQTRMLPDGADWLARVTLWYPSGLQAGLVEYRNGLREGRDVSWDTSGTKRSEGRRLADLREGEWVTWDELGREESRVRYSADRPAG